ncbi:hypothetical protein [Thiofilum flexile]|uniref:hypothetical protein n=1 Tax=Thiofilum flexile TaxID=125627 RepID=UPI00036BE75E|nr:hypothetical protein [Thiofilum flexile]
MKYLVIDASLNGTGIRDKYEGNYLAIDELGLSCEIIDGFNQWLLKYEKEQYGGFIDNDIITELDEEGGKLAILIKNILPEIKLEYFYNARMTREII